MNRRKFLTTAGIVLAGGLFLPKVIRGKNLTDRLKTFSKEINHYKSDKADRDLYLIYQKHAVTANIGFSERFEQESIRESIECQKNIYRILENLYHNKKINLITLEGLSKNYLNDIYNFTSHISKEKWNYLQRLEQGDDSLLKAFLERSSIHSGALLIGENYPKLLFTGWEERENLDLSDKLMQKFIRSKRTSTIEIDNLCHIRSKNSIENSLVIGNILFDKRYISNKNCAIIIGYAHKKDYESLIEKIENNQTHYNLIEITPKGI